MTAPIYQVKADFFRTLGHPARIRVLEVLQAGERQVSELIPEVGIEASHLSQQLGVMRRAGIIQSRKVGSNVYYSVGDPKLFELLEVAKRIITSSLAESQVLLEQMEATDRPQPAGKKQLRPRRGRLN
jgi:ArsR family transcriptional regulator